VASMRMRSIARRIATLEVALSPQPETEHRQGWRWMRAHAQFHPPMQVRFGRLSRLPGDYQGERHVIVAKTLPVQNGQEWVEFAEVPGPDPSPPAPDRRPVRCMDVVFVTANPQPEERAAWAAH